MPGQQGWRVEWVFVDDASPDDAWRVLKQQAAKDERIRAIRLEQNHGQHFAIYAGLKQAKGRYCVVMDCDLEDPPEEIPRLVARLEEGADIVIATYADRAHPAWRRTGSRLYFWMLDTPRPENDSLSMFSVLSEDARSAYAAAPLAGRAYLLVLLRLGLRTAFLASRKEPRHEGVSSYDLRKLWPLAVRNILLFNPRRLAAVLGAIALAMLLVAIWLWGAWPAVPIWLAGVMLAAAALALWRSKLVRRGALPLGVKESLP
jgi:dolichol-phosphate mannosyltransferase